MNAATYWFLLLSAVAFASLAAYYFERFHNMRRQRDSAVRQAAHYRLRYLDGRVGR